MSDEVISDARRSSTLPSTLDSSSTLPFASAKVERHYDAQATSHGSRAAQLAARDAGALIAYKRHANAVKRRMIEEYAGGAELLVDMGCGRGGDINKWREARVRRVMALDLSAAQLDEARRREGQDPSRQATDICWVHASMMQPDLLATLQPLMHAMGGGDAADGVSLQFAMQYAFESEAKASSLLGVARGNVD